MLEVSANVYDDGAAGGDGNVTSQTEYVDADSADNRTTLFGYDWRDEQLWTMVDDLTPDPNNPGSTRKTYTFNTLDNLGDVTDVTRYYDLANTEGLPDNAPNSGDPVIGGPGRRSTTWATSTRASATTRRARRPSSPTPGSTATAMSSARKPAARRNGPRRFTTDWATRSTRTTAWAAARTTPTSPAALDKSTSTATRRCSLNGRRI